MLEAKICLVTGGGSGIGRATVLQMLSQGAEAVIVADRSPQAGMETVGLAADLGRGRADFFEADVTREESVAALMDAVGRRYGRLDVLHNNAGIVEAQVTDHTSLVECPEEAWSRVMDVNLKGTWLCAKHAYPLLCRSESAAIVNCGSVSGQTAIAGEAVYGAAKAGVIQITRSMAAEFASDGIRCNCYCPAAVDTPMTRGEGIDDAAVRRIVNRYLIRRLASPDDVARLVCFLASDEAAFITGSVFPIDGGLLAWPGPRIGGDD